MTDNEVTLNPVLKWAGGKRRLLDQLFPLMPKKIVSYCEPFLGGGAVLFRLHPAHASVSDLNPDLINLYTVIRDECDALIQSLKTHENTAEYFYALRNIDREDPSLTSLSRVERASRLIYLNRTCFNGLYRVNGKGQFNVPFGRYKNPRILDENNIRAVSAYLNDNNIDMCCDDFAAVLDRVGEESFVYLDPPYDPISATSAFTAYNKGGFDRTEQQRLKECCDALTKRKVKFMLSNSSTDFIKALYKDYEICEVNVLRSVNADAGSRGYVAEVVVRNYTDSGKILQKV